MTNFFPLSFERNCYHKIQVAGFYNKWIDAVNRSNILNHKVVIYHVPEYTKNKIVAISNYKKGIVWF